MSEGSMYRLFFSRPIYPTSPVQFETIAAHRSVALYRFDVRVLDRLGVRPLGDRCCPEPAHQHAPLLL